MSATLPQLERKVNQLEQLVRSLLKPKSMAKVFTSGAGAGVKVVQTPGGGIAARSGTTVGSGTCTEFKINSGTLTTNTNTITVKNIWPFAIPASMYIVAVKETISSEWVAVHPGVIDVQWVSPDLEQTLDGSTYANIDTAEVCT